MKLTFTYTPEDLEEWAKYASTAPSSRKFSWSLVGWLLFIALAVLLVMLVQGRNSSVNRPAAPPAPQGDVWTNVGVPMIPWLLIFGFIWVNVIRQMRNKGRRLWRANKDFQKPHAVTIDPEFLEFGQPAVATRYRYTAFDKWGETASLFLFRIPPGQFLCIPKRVTTEAQQAQLRDLFRSQITQVPSGTP